MHEDIINKTFEEALKELEALVKQFEEGKFTLDEAVRAYERGLLLKQHCSNKLEQAKVTIDLVTLEDKDLLKASDA